MTSFFGLEATHNPYRWVLPVVGHVTTGPKSQRFLFGGCGLGASIQALEACCDRPLIWATAQYLSFAPAGATVDLDVRVPVSGNHISQARVIGHIADREIFTVNAALGQRTDPISKMWDRAPSLPSPEECEPMPLFPEREGTIHSEFEVRIAKGLYGERRQGTPSEDGHTLLWMRLKNWQGPIDASSLAIFADLIPGGVGSALGRNAGGNSLDNTIRIRRIMPSSWVLGDIKIHGIHAGFAHGRMLLFAETGELMASASQSLILRIRD